MSYYTEHFNPAIDTNLSCTCGCGVYDYDPEFLDNLEPWRIKTGFGWPVNSGCRCKKKNSHVRTKVSMGEHIVVLGEKRATAIDIGLTDAEKRFIMMDVYYNDPKLKAYFTDVYLAWNFIHIAKGRGNVRLGVKK